MSACHTSEGSGLKSDQPLDAPPKRHHVLISMNDELIAAVEGWRSAHGLSEQSEALGELVRLGLMSEIAKIYRLVADTRPTGPEAGRTGSKAKALREARNGRARVNGNHSPASA